MREFPETPTKKKKKINAKDVFESHRQLTNLSQRDSRSNMRCCETTDKWEDQSRRKPGKRSSSSSAVPFFERDVQPDQASSRYNLSLAQDMGRMRDLK